MDLELIASIVSIALAAGTSLVYATLGEIVTERSGILNLGVEGIMIMGAVTGFAAAFHTDSVWGGVIVAMLVGGLMAAIHAFVTITLLADQVVSGLAMTLFGSGLASFLGQRLGVNGPRFGRIPIPGLAELGPIGESIFNRDVLTYIMYLLVPVMWLFIYKLRAGLVLRSVGENPQASDAMGVDVFRVRYIYTIVGGMLVGLGGAHLSLSYTPGWTENITGGRGWIAVALVIFATWDPIRSVAGALLFGGVNAVQFRLQAAGTNIPASLLNMLPYILTIVVLVVVTWFESLRKRIGAPAALGIPYVREERV